MSKFITSLFLVLIILVVAGPAFALTATWNKDTETDMKDYGVYMCFVTPPATSCTVVKSAAMLQSYVSHVATVNPSYPILVGSAGSVAVSARDLSGNESGLSVPVPFDQVAPQVPAGLTVQ